MREVFSFCPPLASAQCGRDFAAEIASCHSLSAEEEAGPAKPANNNKYDELAKQKGHKSQRANFDGGECIVGIAGCSLWLEMRCEALRQRNLSSKKTLPNVRDIGSSVRNQCAIHRING